MILPVVHYPHPILRQKGKPVAAFDDALHTLLDDMLETMDEHHGVGLAAQQIGRALQVAVIDIGERDSEDRPSTLVVDGAPVEIEEYMPLFLINPVLNKTKAKVEGSEGCLSFPGLYCPVPRSRHVSFTTFLPDGRQIEAEASGFLAIAIQHEYDHLQGKLYIDYLSAAQREEIRPQLDAFEAAYAPSETEDAKRA